ncbi:MAG TPA: hypothetical protein VMW35_10945 [Myxococcota bacterium]|nr:hypothetical protein [Myxococcota bacterium]
MTDAERDSEIGDRRKACDRIVRRWGIVALVGLAVGLRLAIGTWTVDDAYITFRYARNLLNGSGLVYNPGQAVLGTSTPLYAFAPAAVTWATQLDIPTASLWINALADGLVTYLLYRLARQMELPRWAAGLCALGWAFYPISLRYAAGGMESSLVAALGVSAVALFLMRRCTAAVSVAALAVLARPDALVVLFVLLGGLALERRRAPVRELWLVLALWLPWIAWAFVQYGSPVPQSMQAKSHAIYQSQPAENLLQILYQLGSIAIGGPIGLAAKGIALFVPPDLARGLVVAALAVAGLWAIGARYAARIDRRWLVVLAYVPLFFGSYALVGVRGVTMAEWYVVPAMPFVFLGVFAGLAGALRASRSRVTRKVALGLCGWIALAQVAGLNFGRVPGRPWLVPLSIWVEREALYQEAAAVVRERSRPGDVVAATEIGALGYACDCTIFDTVGLVSPEAVAYYPAPDGAFVAGIHYVLPARMIHDLRPAYFISLDVFTRRSTLTAEWFRRDYELVWEARSDAFGSRKMQLYERRTPDR